LNVVYDCRIREVMGYPEPGYCFRRGDDAFLMWSGYLNNLMEGMWEIYGCEFDPDDPEHPHLGQVPLLQTWNETNYIGSHGPLTIMELPATARAFREARAELRQAGPNLFDSLRHGEALATFLEIAVKTKQAVSVEEWWG